MENLTQTWTQSGYFLQTQGTFSPILKIGQEGLPPPPSRPSCALVTVPSNLISLYQKYLVTNKMFFLFLQNNQFLKISSIGSIDNLNIDWLMQVHFDCWLCFQKCFLCCHLNFVNVFFILIIWTWQRHYCFIWFIYWGGHVFIPLFWFSLS